MSKLKMLPVKMLGGGAGFFAVTFLIYFFNLDMKFLAYCVEPILLWNYDRSHASSMYNAKNLRSATGGF